MAHMTSDEEKQEAAKRSLAFIKDGDVVGLGTGSTASHAIRFLGDRVRQGLKIVGIPTSVQSRDLALKLGIPLTDFERSPNIDVTIDGADEINPALELIKGGGGALLREKIVASASRMVVIIADSGKQVSILGKFPLPIEIIPFAEMLLIRRIEALGARAVLRKSPGGALFVTDEGHHILDCSFGTIPDPGKLAAELDRMPGVVEHGLFIGLAKIALIGKEIEIRASGAED